MDNGLVRAPFRWRCKSAFRSISHAIPLIAFFIPWWLRNWKPFSPINGAIVAIRAGQRDRLNGCAGMRPGRLWR